MMKTATACFRFGIAALIVVLFTGSAFAQRNVTLKLNTATAPDTLDAMDVIQIRGAVDDAAPFTLPDANVIDWGDATTLRPMNVGGDNWEVTFQIPENAKLNFKAFSPLLFADTGESEGWENGDNLQVDAGVGDVDLPLHFFNSTGGNQAYDWRPFEDKVDSFAVWFRVFMNTEDAFTKGYDRTDPSQVIGIRGDPMNGMSPLSWDLTLVEVTSESADLAHPGYHLFSGVAYYPDAAAGMTQAYKFFMEPDGWEADIGGVGNRMLALPASAADTTVHWVYFSDSKPLAAQPVESDVLFAVDLSPFEDIGLFSVARNDTIYVFGGFNGWENCPNTNPDLCLMERELGTDIFSAALPLLLIPEQNLGFKFFLDFHNENFMNEFGVAPPSGWEEGHATGTNRKFEFAGTPEQDLGLQYFNDVTPDNVIPAGTSVDVDFAVDMTAALTYLARPFNPAEDSVSVRFGDPIWAFTQGMYESIDGGDFPIAIEQIILTDDDADNVYTGTFTVQGPTYSNLTYRYWYGNRLAGVSGFEDQGSDTDTPGRNRTHFIVPNPDGSWPSSFAVPEGTIQLAAGPLPFVPNPAFSTGIEVIDTELPVTIWLGDNYPNPFNPTTSIEYSIDRATHVKLRVYDLLGRRVATVVDGMLQPALYRSTFDASRLASGVYVYRLETDHKVVAKSMLLIK